MPIPLDQQLTRLWRKAQDALMPTGSRRLDEELPSGTPPGTMRRAAHTFRRLQPNPKFEQEAQLRPVPGLEPPKPSPFQLTGPYQFQGPPRPSPFQAAPSSYISPTATMKDLRAFLATPVTLDEDPELRPEIARRLAALESFPFPAGYIPGSFGSLPPGVQMVLEDPPLSFNMSNFNATGGGFPLSLINASGGGFPIRTFDATGGGFRLTPPDVRATNPSTVGSPDYWPGQQRTSTPEEIRATNPSLVGSPDYWPGQSQPSFYISPTATKEDLRAYLSRPIIPADDDLEFRALVASRLAKLGGFPYGDDMLAVDVTGRLVPERAPIQLSGDEGNYPPVQIGGPGQPEGPPLPSMQTGGLVPQTGPYLLHQGERVLPDQGRRGERQPYQGIPDSRLGYGLVRGAQANDLQAALGVGEGKWFEGTQGAVPFSAQAFAESRATPEGKWFVDARRGVPFQARSNPDPENVWRLVFDNAQLAEAYPGRKGEGYPLLVDPRVLQAPDWIHQIEQARLEQYEHPDFAVDYARLRGGIQAPPEEPGPPANTELDAYQGPVLRGYPGLQIQESGQLISQ